jgi:cytoskeleton protein RodZ
MDWLETTDDFGRALRTTRESVGRSLREMADATKLGVPTLEALERNQIDKLPRGIFRRAVVRAYAREVGLDPENALRVFLSRHPDDLPPPGVTQGPIADVAVPAPGWTSAIVTGVVIGLVVALVVAAYLFWPRPLAAGDTSRSGALTSIAARTGAG